MCRCWAYAIIRDSNPLTLAHQRHPECQLGPWLGLRSLDFEGLPTASLLTRHQISNSVPESWCPSPDSVLRCHPPVAESCSQVLSPQNEPRIWNIGPAEYL